MYTYHTLINVITHWVQVPFLAYSEDAELLYFGLSSPPPPSPLVLLVCSVVSRIVIILMGLWQIYAFRFCE